MERYSELLIRKGIVTENEFDRESVALAVELLYPLYDCIVAQQGSGILSHLDFVKSRLLVNRRPPENKVRYLVVCAEEYLDYLKGQKDGAKQQNLNQIVSGLKIGQIGNGLSVKSFPLSEFDESLAQGYVKLDQLNDALVVRVVDTYGLETKEEQDGYLNQGYVKVGYPLK